MKYISHIVLEEHRPFSYQDFLRFEVDGKEYRMQHGTFRNKISQLIRAEKSSISIQCWDCILYSQGHYPLESPRLR